MYNIQKTILKSQSLSHKCANPACESQERMYFTKEKSLSFENDSGSPKDSVLSLLLKTNTFPLKKM